MLQPSRRRVRRLRVRRTRFLDPALRSAVLQQRTMTCRVHPTLPRSRVRRVRRTRLVQRPRGRPRLDLRMHRILRLRHELQRRVRRIHLVQRPRGRRRLDLRIHRIHRLRHGRQRRVRRTRLIRKQRLDPAIRLLIKARLISKMLLSHRLKPVHKVGISPRNRRNGGHNNETGRFNQTARSARYEPSFANWLVIPTIAASDPLPALDAIVSPEAYLINFDQSARLLSSDTEETHPAVGRNKPVAHAD
jgi:hypothetical protein